MLDDNPVMKERLMAFGAFAGIAVFAMAAVDVMVTGGFDFAAHRAPYDREQPSARVIEVTQYVNDRVRDISWDEPMFVDTADAAEQLVGENDGSASPDETSDAFLHQEIAALYERQQEAEEPAYEDAPAYDEGADASAYYEDEFSPEEAEKVASASGNASPW